MKSEQEFMNGIYKKAETKKEQENNTTVLDRWNVRVTNYIHMRKRRYLQYALVATVVIMVPIVTQSVGKKQDSNDSQGGISLASYEGEPNKEGKSRGIDANLTIDGTVLDLHTYNGNRFLLIKGNDGTGLEKRWLLIQPIIEETKEVSLAVGEQISFTGTRILNSLSSDVIAQLCTNFQMEEEECNALEVYEVETIK